MGRVTIGILALGLAAAMAVFWAAYGYYSAQQIRAASDRLTLYHSTVMAELRRFSHLPFVLSLDPVVAETLEGGDVDLLNHRLARFAHSAGVEAVYLMDRTGTVVAASNARLPGSYVGQNFQSGPYFEAALRREFGEFYGVGGALGDPGYVYAMPVRPDRRTIQGVVAVKVDLSLLQQTWRSENERILLTNSDGVVLLSSEPAWQSKLLAPLTAEAEDRIAQTQQFADIPTEVLDWQANAFDQRARIDGARYLYLRTGNLPNSWTLHYLADDDVALRRAWATLGGFGLLLALAFIAVQVARVRRINAALRRSEEEEAQLRQANERLAIEIEDRRAAERSLQKTQAELERAGRLAALGQLAASVTHELGQPIAAMRNQLAAAEIQSGESPLTGKMHGLVARMEDITRQLKFFTRKGRDQFEDVDLRDTLAASLELLAPRIEEVEAVIHPSTPSTPVEIHGNRLRLEQVMTNLIRNALDAVEGADPRQIDVTVGANDAEVWFEVADTGHGLKGQSFDDLREPFATTRASGQGMGLGLTISAGVVTDHGGQMQATDRAGGGAVFRATFPLGQMDTQT